MSSLRLYQVSSTGQLLKGEKWPFTIHSSRGLHTSLIWIVPQLAFPAEISCECADVPWLEAIISLFITRSSSIPAAPVTWPFVCALMNRVWGPAKVPAGVWSSVMKAALSDRSAPQAYIVLAFPPPSIPLPTLTNPLAVLCLARGHCSPSFSHTHTYSNLCSRYKTGPDKVH